jgi:hypothetical protein
LVADALGFRYVDEEIVLEAAEKEGVDPELLATVERMRTGLSRLAEIDIVTFGAIDDMQRSLIRAAIEHTAAPGKVVIVAHAASIALAGDDRCCECSSPHHPRPAQHASCRRSNSTSTRRPNG